MFATAFWDLFNAERFMPHGHCYQWDPGILWTSVISDGLIAAAYVGIPVTLVFQIMRKRNDLPFNWMFACFGTFIVACGFTHIMEIITVWHPFYGLSDLVKVVTAAASVSTAIILYRIAPKIVALPTVDRLVEEQTRRARAEATNETKDRFIASLSHELRTPLTPVKAALELVEGELSRHKSICMNETVQDAFRMIRDNLKTEMILINDLIDFSASGNKKLKFDLEPIDLAKVAAETLRGVEEQAQEKGIRLSQNLAGNQVIVLGASVRLRQIISNLLDNAIKYTPAGGEIRLNLKTENKQVHLQIADTGRGLADGDIEKIFQPFEQLEWRGERAKSGMGLGLTISRALAQAQGGNLAASSAGAGQGTSFTLTLPASDRSLQAPAFVAKEPASSIETEKPHLLIVDDHPDTLQVLALLLRRAGYSVLTAETVAEAESRLNECEILVSDIGLPDGNGWDLMQRFKARGGRAGVAISGFGQEEDIRRSQAAGFAEHLVKPIEISSLIKVLQDIGSPAATT